MNSFLMRAKRFTQCIGPENVTHSAGELPCSIPEKYFLSIYCSIAFGAHSCGNHSFAGGKKVENL